MIFYSTFGYEFLSGISKVISSYLVFIFLCLPGGLCHTEEEIFFSIIQDTQKIKEKMVCCAQDDFVKTIHVLNTTDLRKF